MASQVLSGSSNPSYTNTTGQNVRVVINFMQGSPTISGTAITMSWSGSATLFSNTVLAIGRNLAFNGGIAASGYTNGNNAVAAEYSEIVQFAFPTEIMLAPGQSFSATCSTYNIVVIPENG